MPSLGIYTGRKSDAHKHPGPNLQQYSDSGIEHESQVAMWTLKRILLSLASMMCLLVGASAHSERYQTFLKEHQDNPKTVVEDSDYCRIRMNHRTLVHSCKTVSVFIHASETQLQDVCKSGGYSYHGTGHRRSRKLYPVTVCRLVKMTRARQCIYHATFSSRHIVLSCDGQNLPVHLDEVLTVAS